MIRGVLLPLLTFPSGEICVVSFTDKLIECIRDKQSISCVGIDPQVQFGSEKSPIPLYLLNEFGSNVDEVILQYFKGIIEEVVDLVPIFKLQIAYFEQYDAQHALKELLAIIKQRGALAIVDAKRNDIGSTSEAYAAAIFGGFQADAMTVNGYLGTDCILPFTAYDGKGIFALVKTSNPSSIEFQDLFSVAIESAEPRSGRNRSSSKQALRNYLQMANLVHQWGADHIGSCGYSDVGAVVGATYPVQMSS